MAFDAAALVSVLLLQVQGMLCCGAGTLVHHTIVSVLLLQVQGMLCCGAGTLVHHTIGWWDVKLDNAYKGCSEYRVGEYRASVSVLTPCFAYTSVYCCPGSSRCLPCAQERQEQKQPCTPA